ncbi:MAG: radical SAM protein [Bacteroidota bacterium]|nr:radical SAM protein [Bacteroidota bacterium]
MPPYIEVKSILNKKKKRDSWFLDDYTINPYSACSFNCLFCYTQGSKWGTNMADKVSIKANALEILEKQLYLRSKKQQYGFIVMSSSTDPYLHFEKDTLLTRQMLELIHKYRFPVHIITRSDLITRDLDILKQIDRNSILPPDLQTKLNNKVLITFSFSTIEQSVATIFEPGATKIEARLQTLHTCLKEGFKSGVSLMPLLPFLSDTKEQLEKTFSLFGEMKINYILPASLTLFGNERGDGKWLMFRAIEKHYPHLMEKYKSYFDHSTHLPDFYNQAFYKKMKELCLKYRLKDRIV